MKIKPLLFGCYLIICSIAVPQVSALPMLGRAPVSRVYARDCEKHYSNKNWQKAFSACTEKAEQGDAKAQNNLGAMYYHGYGVRKDFQKSFEWVEKAAIQGNAEAQNNLGGMYYHGLGVRQDKHKAVQLYEKAAQQGLAQAQYSLGGMCYNGDGVRQDKHKAKEWFGKACDNGLQNGCNIYKKLNEAGY